jgi:hypothetical protein
MKPDLRCLFHGLLYAQDHLLIGKSAERMLNDHWAQPFCFVRESLGDDNGRRPPPLFEAHSVMQTARRTRSSIADRRERYVIMSRDFSDQFGAREP